MKQLRNHQTNAISSLSLAGKGTINLPTGTGKTLIQSRAIVDAINEDNSPKVYVILSPRILLSNQLMGDVKEDLVINGQDCQYLVVHSGRVNGDYSALEKELNIPYRETPSSTSHQGIMDVYEKAQRENVPMIISGTYHSAERIVGSGIPVEILFCDEAHYLVQEQFSWIVSDPFPSNRTYFFTATLRETPSEEGLGMNNVDLFGEVLYQELPIQLIEAGEMVRPRMHMIDMSHDPEGDEADGLAVAEAFIEHHSNVNVGAKLLVVSKDGSDNLDALVNHVEIQRLLNVRPSLRIFDVSSEHGARIDGVVVRRDQFLTELRAMEDHEEAIIIHYDILSEGIDVPGITGVMPLRSLQKAKFLQTLGRSTRLHSKDRTKLYTETMMADELSKFVKPYAWLIIPIYGEIGDDLYEEMKEMVRELRDHGFNPSEDIVVKQKRGKSQLVSIENVTEPTKAIKGLLEFSAIVIHELEEEDEAQLIKESLFDISKQTNEEILKNCLTF